ncbi:MAG: hypothetical protein M3Y87_16605 [Myxococcota bacterium]|nr:hypothetical protein [Myxococcota bacterium]
MELANLETTHEGERLRVGPTLVRHLVDETTGLERVLARREEALGAALEQDLFPDGAPVQVLPVEVRRALARKLESALHAWVASPPAHRAHGVEDVARPLRAIAESVRAGDEHDEMHDYLFPAGVPDRLGAAELLRSFRHAAAREQRSLVRLVSLVPAFESWDTLIEHEIAGRTVLVVRLWVISVRWYALAAGRMNATHARSFQALVEKWTKVEHQMRLVIEA